MKNKYQCKDCGKIVEGEKAENCCGHPMQKIDQCPEAFSPEHARMGKKDDPCDDGIPR